MLRIFACILIAFSMFSAAWTADTANAEVRVRSQIVYNAKTKSYFQYIEHDVQDSQSWETADRLARKLVYKGVRGRLAIVTDDEVNTFLRQTFSPRTYTWIGLRYSCRYRRLIWVNGELVKPKDYQNWARVWYRNAPVTCEAQPGSFPFMPIYYLPADHGFRWQASGPKKRMYSYFVEYPTGGE